MFIESRKTLIQGQNSSCTIFTEKSEKNVEKILQEMVDIFFHGINIRKVFVVMKHT